MWTSRIRALDPPLIPPSKHPTSTRKTAKLSLLINGCLKPTSRCSCVAKLKDVENIYCDFWFFFCSPAGRARTAPTHKCLRSVSRVLLSDQTLLGSLNPWPEKPNVKLKEAKEWLFSPYRSQPWCLKTYKEKNFSLSTAAFLMEASGSNTTTWQVIPH